MLRYSTVRCSPGFSGLARSDNSGPQQPSGPCRPGNGMILLLALRLDLQFQAVADDTLPVVRMGVVPCFMTSSKSISTPSGVSVSL